MSMYDYYPYFKAFHLIGVVSWFAGLFYIVRLFIYHVEALEKPEAEMKILTAQFKIMERRLWKAITVPAMWFTAIFGLILIYYHDVKIAHWLHLKFTLLIFLFHYHFKCGKIRKALERNETKWTSKKLRLFNEVPTFLLLTIVLIAVSKDLLMTLYGTIAFVVFIILVVLLFLKKLQGKND